MTVFCKLKHRDDQKDSIRLLSGLSSMVPLNFIKDEHLVLPCFCSACSIFQSLSLSGQLPLVPLTLSLDLSAVNVPTRSPTGNTVTFNKVPIIATLFRMKPVFNPRQYLTSRNRAVKPWARHRYVLLVNAVVDSHVFLSCCARRD